MSRISVWKYAVTAAAVLGAGLQVSPALAGAPASAYVVPQARLDGLADFVDGVMAQQIATREVAGAVVTVVHGKKVLFTRGYGLADVDAGVAVDAQQTLFRPGSVSKMFTWAALLQQVELGRVDLDADVNTYLDYSIPEFGGQPIRVRDLFSHAPGMSDVTGITVGSLGELEPYRTWMKTHIPQRLWPAGSEVSYSNYGAALAGYIVESVSGEPFADYTERHLFGPLGMNATTFREPLPVALAPRMAKGYRLEDGRFIARPFELYSVIMPAGSATTSAPDMTRFMMAMLNRGSLDGARILKPESVSLLMSDSVANAPNLPGMANGFFVLREKDPRLVGHGGNTADFHSYMVLAPEAGIGFFVSETGGRGSNGGRTELTEALIGRLFPVAPGPRVAAPADEVLPVGAYRINRRDYTRPVNPEQDFQVKASGPNAILLAADDRTTYWERIGPHLFERVTGARAGGPYERLRFYEKGGGWRLSFSSQPYVAYHLVKP